MLRRGEAVGSYARMIVGNQEYKKTPSFAAAMSLPIFPGSSLAWRGGVVAGQSKAGDGR